MSSPRTAVALLLFCATTALAQPYLVKDLNTTGPISGSSYPRAFATFNSSLYFATSGRDEAGVWRLDGATSTPVRILKGRGIVAITPFRGRLMLAGSGLSLSDGTEAPITPFSTATVYDGPLLETAAGRVVFVRVQDELWSTDGTTDGTAKIDLHTTTTKANLLGTFGGRVVFVSTSGVGITDGTQTGTTILTTSATKAGNITVSGDRFFFAGFRDSGDYDGALWVSDGTPAGTHALKSKLTSTYAAIVPIGSNRVVYWPGDPKALWVSDGTDAGTVAVANVHNIANLAAVLNGVVYFEGSDSNYVAGTLWRTDGTAAGTRAVATLPDRYLSGITTALGRIWITTYDYGTDNVQSAHFSFSDGTSIRPLARNNTSDPLVEAFGRVYFPGWDAAHGLELWSSDGTPEATAMVADLEPNIAASSYPKTVAASATRVVFAATETSSPTGMWSTDGTAEGTQPFPYKIYRSIRFGDFVYFTRDDKRAELYRTDGTARGTQLVYVFPNSDTYPVIATNELLYVNSGYSTWATDGTGDGTSLVANYSTIGSAINLGGHVVYDNGYGTLYEINGRNAPRVILAGVNGWKFTAGGRIFFLSSTFGVASLAVNDGTADGMRLLATFARGGGFLGSIADRVLFQADDGTHGYELWASDGTPEGTTLVRDIRPGAQGSIINDQPLGVVNDRMLFIANDGTFGTHLWSSDGTAAGTVMLPAASFDNAVIAKGLAFFTTSDPLTGTELWQTDGTVEGTRLAGDIYAGPRSSYPANLLATRDTLYFQATTLETGNELWALPVPGRTIAIDDARAPNGATTATMTVSLDGPSTQAVTATWSSTTGASGAIAFAPGETKKSITFAITPDLVTRLNRFDNVRLSDIRGAIATKSFATVIKEGAVPHADLSVSIAPGPSSSARSMRSLVVTNHGPDTAPASTAITRGSISGPAYSSSSTVPSIAPGASASITINPNGYLSAVVSSPTADPDPTNNSLTVVESVSTDQAISISCAPAALSAGMHATLTMQSTSGSASLTSSDPSVIAVPATASEGNVDVVALAPGITTITIASGKSSTSITVSVAAAGATYRWPSQMTLTIDGDRVFGTPIRLIAKTPSFAWDANVTPTGPVTFYDGDTVLAVAYVSRYSAADTYVDSLLPGTHTIKAVYAGDTRFFGTTAPPQTITIAKPPPVTFYGTYDPRSATTAEITIVAVAPRSRPATGTITLKNFGEVLAENLTFVGSVTVTTKRIPFVTVFYSGDDLYEPAVVSVQLSPVRHRAAP